MKIFVILFSLCLICNVAVSQENPCPGGTTIYFNELNPIIDQEKKTITYPNFDCMSCEYEDSGENCRCRKACGNNEGCLRACGDLVPATRVINGYTIRVEVWYSTEIITSVPPPMTTPDESFTDDPTKDEELPGCYVYTFSGDWNGYKSFCVKTNVVVSYTDGTCCIYQDRICEQIK